MKPQTILFAVAGLLLFAFTAATTATSKPDFSGTWELDQTKSHSIPPDMKQTMTVVQEGDKVSVETRIVTAQGERVVRDSFMLDGKEVEFTPPAPRPQPQEQQPPTTNAAPPAPKGKRAARWLPNGNGFVVEEEIKTETPQGTTTALIARKWIIWADGTLTIEILQEDHRGSFSSKRAFVKK
ncbi:MAG TPA: hypothetical protein VF666_21675 [Pyrinomonadaceae bacterium]|jgi:hypothetical protein